jgi:hypothetical protein
MGTVGLMAVPGLPFTALCALLFCTVLTGVLTVGQLMAAVPLGMVIGAFLLGRVTAPSVRIRMMGWLAVLSCASLIGSAWNPPVWAVLALWTLAGAGGAYQLAAAAAFVRALRPDTRTRAFGLTAATMLAMRWTHLRGRLIQARPNGPESP